MRKKSMTKVSAPCNFSQSYCMRTLVNIMYKKGRNSTVINSVSLLRLKSQIDDRLKLSAHLYNALKPYQQ